MYTPLEQLTLEQLSAQIANIEAAPLPSQMKAAFKHPILAMIKRLSTEQALTDSVDLP